MRSFVVMCCVMSSFGLFAGKKSSDWSVPTGNLSAVFIIRENDKSTELVRLYDSGLYEHLSYENTSKTKQKVFRNLGLFGVSKSKIMFTTPKQNEFTGKFKGGVFYMKGGLYHRKIDKLLFRGKVAYLSTQDEVYRKPFFVQLKRKHLVSNSEAGSFLKLEDVVNYWLQGVDSEEEKIEVLKRFLCEHVDHAEMKTLPSSKTSTMEIIAGGMRSADSRGYAMAFAEICNQANIPVRMVRGIFRKSIAENLDPTFNHYWNIIPQQNGTQLADMYMADVADKLNYAWCNVHPELMIHSHYPEVVTDQLLAKPISYNEFAAMPVILPGYISDNTPLIKVHSLQFCDKEITLRIPGEHAIRVSRVPATVLNKKYKEESPVAEAIRPELLTNVVLQAYKDSTSIKIPLIEGKNILTVDVDGAYTMSFVAVKNGAVGLYENNIVAVDTRYADPYLRAILSCLKLNRLDELKRILGEDLEPIYLNGERLNFTSKQMKELKNWNGDLSELTIYYTTVTSVDPDGKTVVDEVTEQFIEIPDGPRFFLERISDHYHITHIDWP